MIEVLKDGDEHQEMMFARDNIKRFTWSHADRAERAPCPLSPSAQDVAGACFLINQGNLLEFLTKNRDAVGAQPLFNQ